MYEQAIGTHHGLPSQLPAGTQAYNGHPITPLQDYRPRSEGHYQTFGQSIGAQLHSATQGLPMYQQQGSFQQHTHTGLSDMQTDWPLDQHAQAQEQYPMASNFTQDFTLDGFNMPFSTSTEDFVPASQAHYDATFPSTYMPLNTQVDMPFNLQGFSNELGYAGTHGFPDTTGQHHPNSPTDSTLDARSLSSSDNGWAVVDFQNSFPDAAAGAIFNPGQTLHGRTFSDSSHSDAERQRNRISWDGFVDVPQHAIGSPDSDSAGEAYLSAGRSSNQQSSPSIKQESKPTSPVLPKSTTKPIRIKTSTSPQRSPISPSRNSPPGRKQPRKNSNKASKPTIRKQAQQPKGEAEKRVGRRKGPLRPEQRKQASEIRKLGACLRCKFLKKTCDAGEPCHGCCPSHQRQWQVPCTRMDIKDLAYFMADWNTHFHQNVGVGFTIANIAGHGSGEQTLYVTHGYGGHLLPIRAREVLVREKDCFGLEWVEEFQKMSIEHSVETARLSSGKDGISTTLLSAYLDKHIDIGFEQFVDEFFEGTPFLTEMLKTSHRYWTRENTQVIRKALKMMLAYNLIYHITLVEGIPEEEDFPGKIEDEDSRFYGKTIAPGMINFEVKVAMSAMWRELQKEVLEDLSKLYRGVYSKDKLMNWPIIFMVITILLAVWEELQFDYNYRYPVRITTHLPSH